MRFYPTLELVMKSFEKKNYLSIFSLEQFPTSLGSDM